MSPVIDSCYSSVFSQEEVERIEKIPGVTRKYIECWKISTDIFVNEERTPIVLYAGFKNDFPYSLPSFYFPYSRFGYLPHIESKDGKMCLFEDGASYSTDSPEELVLYCIKKAKTLVREGAEKKNFSDFRTEIASYWAQCYNGEPLDDECFVLYGQMPSLSTTLNVLRYATPIEGLSYKNTRNISLLYESENEPFDSYLSKNFTVSRGKALYIDNYQFSDKAPYDVTFSAFLNGITCNEDKRKVVYFINRNNGGIIIFKLTESKIGGISVPSIQLNRKGFRKGILKTSDVYLQFEKKYSQIERLYGVIYSKKRVAERTSGKLMTEHQYAIAGLGSIGSNLVHFLNGYNNAQFTLIDDDILSLDNIGRHLLGFRYINQFKAHAIAAYLHSIRPEQEISSRIITIQEYFHSELDELNKHTALFVCTGDTMTDEYIIKAINNNILIIPVFFLWLEPYGAAAHLIYVNRAFGQQNLSVINPDTMLYKNNLIEDAEYKKKDNQFSKNDAGCSGAYTLYSGNDVLEMLCAFYPIISKLISEPEESKCYRWIGNIEDVLSKGIRCKDHLKDLPKGTIQELPL